MGESLWIGVVSAVFVVLVLSKLLFWTNRKYRNLPPSPPRLPILGHLHLVKEPAHRSFQELADKYGPIIFLSFGYRPVVIVSSPSLVEECFAKNDVVLADRPRLLAGKLIHYNYTTVGASMYGSHWRNLRKLTSLEILSTNRLNLSTGIRQEEVGILIKRLFGSFGTGQGEFVKVGLRSGLSEMSFNGIMRMMSGKRYFGAEVEDPEEAEQFRGIVREVLRLSGASNLGDYLPVPGWVDLQSYGKKLVAVMKRIDEFLLNLIEEHRKKRGSNRSEGKSSETMIDAVLSLQESQPEYYSDVIIKGLMVVMLTAGTDTTTVTLEWAMALLLNHPDELNKARAEIDKHVGQDRLVQESDLPKLKYLQCIINETLRLFPSAPLLVPHAASDDCKIGGYDVPKGAMLLVNAWAIHRDPKVWADALSFRPQSFEGGEVEAYKFLPFGLGRRACPGIGLANRVVGLALAALIQCFEWKRLSEEEIDMSEGTGLTMPKLESLEAMCKPRQSTFNLLSNL